MRPRTLLPKLVLQWGCADDAAARVAALLGCDLVAEVLQATLAPVRPPPAPGRPPHLASGAAGRAAGTGAAEEGAWQGGNGEGACAAGGRCDCAFCR